MMQIESERPRRLRRNLPHPISIGHPLHAGLEPMIIGYSVMVKSPKVTFFWGDIVLG